jgi:hypothetical protein
MRVGYGPWGYLTSNRDPLKPKTKEGDAAMDGLRLYLSLEGDQSAISDLRVGRAAAGKGVRDGCVTEDTSSSTISASSGTGDAAVAPQKARGGRQSIALNWWQLNVDSKYRRNLHFITPLFSACPRAAVFLLSYFDWPSQGSVPETRCGWFQWLLFPEFYLFQNSDEILGGQSRFTAYPLLIQSMRLPIILLLKWDASPSNFAFDTRLLLKKELFLLAFQLLLTVVFFVEYLILWCVMPWFVCDLILLVAVYLLPALVMLLEGLWVVWNPGNITGTPSRGQSNSRYETNPRYETKKKKKKK